MRVEIFEGKDNRFYWSAYSRNGEIIATSAGGQSRGYSRRADTKKAFLSFCHQAANYLNQLETEPAVRTSPPIEKPSKRSGSTTTTTTTGVRTSAKAR